MAQDSHARSNQHDHQHKQQRRQRLSAGAVAGSAGTTSITREEEQIFEEIIPLPFRKAYDMAEKFATTRIGQFVIMRGDRLLKMIETTAKWSLPHDQMDDKRHRPLPWIPFLMIIIALRLARVWVSLGALIIGNAPVKAQDVVYFVQTRRRKLRALRLRGMKEICRRETEMMARKPGYGQNTFMFQLKSFFSSAICRPGQLREPERRIMIHHGKEVIYVDTDSSEHQIAKRPRADDCEVDMTVDELLNKYANDVTEDDSDFVPNQDEENGDDSTTSSESSESSSASETLFEESTEQQDSDKRGHCHSKNMDSPHNQSVELKENGSGKPVKIPKPMVEIKHEMSSDTESSEMAKTSYGNGPSNGAENREVDVAFKFVLRPNGNEISMVTRTEEPKKLIPEHRSSTDMKLLETTTVAASKSVQVEGINLTTNDTSTDAVDSIVNEIKNEIKTETETEKSSFNISNNDSSPTLSAASSSAFLESFMRNEKSHENTKSVTYATATSKPTNDEETITDFENTTINSVSSSEDDFYSPIGSPPDFNAFQQKQQQKQQKQQAQMNFKFSNMPISKNQSKTVNEPSTDESPSVDTFYPTNSAPSISRNQHYQPHHGNFQRRYRGRNRRN